MPYRLLDVHGVGRPVILVLPRSFNALDSGRLMTDLTAAATISVSGPIGRTVAAFGDYVGAEPLFQS